MHEAQAQEVESAKAKPRKKAAKIIGPARGSRRADDRRLTERQAAAAQLPRQERWKRRLHPAAW
ncbi:hypothetical protein DC522_28995 [Microvirga sp. KLBC 81]|nr:hypothetical protein DC522_28995 [Microvirga sp. KLBC 81]